MSLDRAIARHASRGRSCVGGRLLLPRGCNGKAKEPAYIIPPEAITKSNWKELITANYLKKSDICNGDYTKYC